MVLVELSQIIALCTGYVTLLLMKISVEKAMEKIMRTSSLEGLLGILATKDAHRLYEKYGFHKNSDRFMKKARKI